MTTVTFSPAQRQALWTCKCSLARCFMKRTAAGVQRTASLAPYGLHLEPIIGAASHAAMTVNR